MVDEAVSGKVCSVGTLPLPTPSGTATSHEAVPGKVCSGFPSGTATSHKCPECGKPAAAAFAPFCSVRCQQIDLGRWLKGDYMIPGKPDEDRAGTGIPAPGDDPDAE